MWIKRWQKCSKLRKLWADNPQWSDRQAINEALANKPATRQALEYLRSHWGSDWPKMVEREKEVKAKQALARAGKPISSTTKPSTLTAKLDVWMEQAESIMDIRREQADRVRCLPASFWDPVPYGGTPRDVYSTPQVAEAIKQAAGAAT